MSLSGKIETTANVATIFVAVLLSIVLTKVYILPSNSAKALQPPNPSATELIGKPVDGHLLGIDWAKNHRTLILAISTKCHFCTESGPFFHTLGVKAGKDVKMVAVLPQPVAESEQYLSRLDVQVDQVKQASLPSLGVRGTPTLLLVNDVGVVTHTWEGKLLPYQEAQVLKNIGG